MRIAVTSDIHIDKNGPEVCEMVAARARALEADVLIVAGDVATSPTVLLRSFLTLRRGARTVLYVAGNHDVWSHPDLQAKGQHAWWRLDNLLPALCHEAGIHNLDAASLEVDGVGFVGTLGWWDLSTRDPDLDAPPEAYIRGEFAGLRWMDHTYAHFPDADGRPQLPETVAATLRGRLREQLAACSSERIVAVTHMVAFREQLHHKAHPGWRFAQAFIGHLGLGAVIEADPRVLVAIAGHTHIPSDFQRGRLRVLCSPLGYQREWQGRPAADAVSRAVALVAL
jgi:predicted phosphodiesterase